MDLTKAAAAAATTNYPRFVDDIHPPREVTLSPAPHYDPIIPLPDSPLSTPPDSPRKRHDDVESDDNDDDPFADKTPSNHHRREEHFSKKATLLVERRSSLELPLALGGKPNNETVITKKQQEPSKMHKTNNPTTTTTTTATSSNSHRRVNSDAPFDESNKKKLQQQQKDIMSMKNNNINNNSDVPDDEKKLDDSFESGAGGSSTRDELMEPMTTDNTSSRIRKTTTIITTSTSNCSEGGGGHLNIELRNSGSTLSQGYYSNTMGSNSNDFQQSSSFQTAPSSDLMDDEIMNDNNEPPSLQIVEPPRLPIVSSKEELEEQEKKQRQQQQNRLRSKNNNNDDNDYGYLPDLSSPASPTLELPYHSSPESSSSWSADQEPPPLSLAAVAAAATRGQRDNDDDDDEAKINTSLLSKPSTITLNTERSKTTGDITSNDDEMMAVATAATTKTSTTIDRPKRYTRGKTYSHGTTGRKGNVDFGVDREQHLKFAALKREIISRQYQQSLLNSNKNELTQIPSSSSSSLGSTPSFDAPRQAAENNKSLKSATTTTTTTNNNNNNRPVMISPDGDILEMSVMVSPDGEIDFTKPIVNLAPTNDEGDDEEDHHNPRRDLLPTRRPNDNHISNNDNNNNDKQIKSVKSYDGSSTSGSKGSRGSGNKAYVPPDRAWGDYLTFRGVAVESPAKKETFDISSIGKVWIASSSNAASPIKTSISGGQQQQQQQEEPQPRPIMTLSSPEEKKQQSLHEKELLASGWPQDEFSRLTYMKQEINSSSLGGRGESMFEKEISPRSDETSYKSIENIEPSLSTMDDEVAAINADEIMNKLVQVPSSDGRIPGNQSAEKTSGPRRLFGVQENDTSNFGASVESDGEFGGEPIDYDLMQVQMTKFASETRAALRDQSFAELAQASPSSKFMPVMVSSPLSVDPSTAVDETDVSSQPQNKSLSDWKAGTRTINSRSTGTDFADMQGNDAPILIKSMDCFEGIAQGDITLSLLSENTGATQTKVSATWANRVQGAIWRSRKMRRDMAPTTENHHRSQNPSSPPRGRSSLPVDVDQARVAGSFRTVQSTEEAALLHLKHDELDEAIELFEDIIFAYYSYFERSLDMREKNPNADIGGIGSVDFKLYIGVALHNLGVLNLLKGEYGEALSFFTRAAENRRTHLGDEHPDHIVSIEFPRKKEHVCLCHCSHVLFHSL